mgnify:FL=1
MGCVDLLLFYLPEPKKCPTLKSVTQGTSHELLDFIRCLDKPAAIKAKNALARYESNCDRVRKKAMSILGEDILSVARRSYLYALANHLLGKGLESALEAVNAPSELVTSIRAGQVDTEARMEYWEQRLAKHGIKVKKKRKKL